jgi:hypothetical protein
LANLIELSGDLPYMSLETMERDDDSVNRLAQCSTTIINTGVTHDA